ncbi:LysR family transcriptional regulator ArgP [uncultured Pseudodesulfovibrio sp.]|uniref:LysR family transcriptional regulator ArgP n=1 Tax=uncultured Pseudodesulfovibrio sp. TaxID=2035858 RepID=UPI0029C6D32A|nr:LysR family transcriptional regulator ArgP [uncultured Pseudodesulfovibrio sp.]
MLDYKLIEAFAAVVEAGGFEKGAALLHLTQSAVSQRVKLLEEQAGCVLLVRSSPPKPTTAGRNMLRHYRQVKRLEDDLGGGLGRETDGFTTLPVGVNADSLATWFFPAVNGYLDAEPVLLDIRVDDQEQTHGLLRDGEVLGCVSARAEAMQGCRVEYLGDMDYHLYGSPSYKTKWCKHGATLEMLEEAPMLIFNRKDEMHELIFAETFGEQPSRLNAFYMPSSEQFAPVIASGRGAGMVPEQQAAEYVERGEVVDLLPGHTVRVRLYWHCWNLASARLVELTEAMVKGARRELVQRA